MLYGDKSSTNATKGMCFLELKFVKDAMTYAVWREIVVKPMISLDHLIILVGHLRSVALIYSLTLRFEYHIPDIFSS